jgi:hypothetical protein
VTESTNPLIQATVESLMHDLTILIEFRHHKQQFDFQLNGNVNLSKFPLGRIKMVLIGWMIVHCT